MLSKLKGKPLWYKAWAVAAALATVFVLIRMIYTDEWQQLDRALLVFSLMSSLMDFFLFPPEDAGERMPRKKRGAVIAVGFAVGLLAAVLLL